MYSLKNLVIWYMSCFTGNYKESDFRRDLTFEENMEPYPLSMVGAFDVVLSLNSEIVDSCGEFYFEKKLKDEVWKNTILFLTN